ncbi:hypothetical protein EVAR_79664_1 [Eumeta japonica]|uniref:Uncharacterized protein n=1 Tax=Eumeta variegata TaxID=151549 RepID=A0A4C1WCG7_EUMVA|nr:hypothetical protein EVAR_79664_1 [Eumeta japonica]
MRNWSNKTRLIVAEPSINILSTETSREVYLSSTDVPGGDSIAQAERGKENKHHIKNNSNLQRVKINNYKQVYEENRETNAELLIEWGSKETSEERLTTNILTLSA